MLDRYWMGLIRSELGRFCAGFKYEITNDIGGERGGGGSRRGYVKIGFTLHRYQVYKMGQFCDNFCHRV